MNFFPPKKFSKILRIEVSFMQNKNSLSTQGIKQTYWTKTLKFLKIRIFLDLYHNKEPKLALGPRENILKIQKVSKNHLSVNLINREKTTNQT